MFFLCLNLRYTYFKHRGRIHTEERAKVALLVKEKFLGLHPFWEDARVVVWCGVNQPFFQSIHFAMLFILFFKSSWCKIRPPSISDNLCLLFCIYPSSIIVPICGSNTLYSCVDFVPECLGRVVGSGQDGLAYSRDTWWWSDVMSIPHDVE